MKKVCIFCSANKEIDPDFFETTRQLGRWLAEVGHSVVYGGVNMGLMECIAEAAHNAGGQTVGVVPRIIEQRGAHAFS